VDGISPNITLVGDDAVGATDELIRF